MSKNTRIGWSIAGLTVGAACVVALIQGNGALTTGNVVTLGILGTVFLFVSTVGLGRHKAPQPIGTPIRTMILLGMCAGLMITVCWFERPSTNSSPLPQHTHVDYVSIRMATLRVHEEPTANIGFRNSGDFAVKESSDAYGLFLVKAISAPSAFSGLLAQLKYAPPGGALAAHSPTVAYHTAVGPRLTASDLNGLQIGDLDLCAVGAVHWLDETGKYETHFYECLQAEPDHKSSSWHSMKESDEEIRIQ